MRAVATGQGCFNDEKRIKHQRIYGRADPADSRPRRSRCPSGPLDLPVRPALLRAPQGQKGDAGAQGSYGRDWRYWSGGSERVRQEIRELREQLARLDRLAREGTRGWPVRQELRDRLDR